MRPSKPSLVMAFVLLATLAGCSGTSTVTVHGRVIKSVGRSCDLLSAAFPGVAGRVISFIDETGAEVGRTTTGTQRTVEVGQGGCELSSSYRIALPVRNTYAANVSSAITQIPTSPTIDYDTLAGKGWAFDVQIPATA